ncbi:hypothetical protein Cme02nite_24830 [Catellatospora methionotrophica]|uniref:Uncharacterized protein n=1 Tax=Catellatospora methionotrophica TaxID=121620 RepID=A0A8J3LFG8_9ACTN|nr:hypothetical protein Cme02nite_24830 [Catellatospora methionotrophica]
MAPCGAEENSAGGTLLPGGGTEAVARKPVASGLAGPLGTEVGPAALDVYVYVFATEGLIPEPGLAAPRCAGVDVSRETTP